MWKSKNGKVHYESFEELVPQKKKEATAVHCFLPACFIIQIPWNP